MGLWGWAVPRRRETGWAVGHATDEFVRISSQAGEAQDGSIPENSPGCLGQGAAQSERLNVLGEALVLWVDEDPSPGTEAIATWSDSEHASTHTPACMYTHVPKHHTHYIHALIHTHGTHPHIPIVHRHTHMLSHIRIAHTCRHTFLCTCVHIYMYVLMCTHCTHMCAAHMLSYMPMTHISTCPQYSHDHTYVLNTCTTYLLVTHAHTFLHTLTAHPCSYANPHQTHMPVHTHTHIDTHGLLHTCSTHLHMAQTCSHSWPQHTHALTCQWHTHAPKHMYNTLTDHTHMHAHTHSHTCPQLMHSQQGWDSELTLVSLD